MGLSNTAKRMILLIGAVSAVFAVGAVIYYRSTDALPFVIGLVMLAAVNVLKAVLLDKSVNRVSGMEEKDGRNFMRGGYLLRLVITGAALLFAALSDAVSIWGAVAGICTWQIAAYMLKLFID
ncbi:MAG: ATP synthase subunit I [Oscillospiraceae bacterium]|nr:ATP synthase subunit I [Oscillospiraceae bacterium]